VTNALTLKDKMEAAFDEILARSGSSSTVTVSSGSLNTDALLFQALFDTDGWVGVVKAIEINETTGALESTNWEFSDKLRTQLARTGGQNSQREVITVNGSGNGVPFRFPADYTSLETDEMTSAQVSDLLSGISSGQQSYGEDLVDYIRGDSSEESGVTGATRSFREREGAGGHIALGDIVHSDPLYVTAPGFFYGDSWPTTLEGFGATAPENSATQKYSDFRTLLKDREPVLYVGANDGMLHGINAYKNTGSTTDGGEEIIAFVPGELYSKLPDLADSSYTHDYFVDGKTTYGDVFFAGDSKWHTSLVGTLNGGGQSVFSLDITDPKGIASGAPYASFDESNAEDLVLWEFSDADDPDLGFTFGRPTIVRLANGQWGAVFGNGYDNTDPDGTVSSTGNAAVFIVNIETGALIKKFDTEQGFAQDPTSTGQPNGMSEAAPVDIDGDFIADYIYAGDLFGNMWKIDISHPNSANWGFSYASSGQPAPLYEAKSATGNRLPITQRPQVGSHPLFGYSGDVLVYFGTGKYLENSDNSTVGEETQSYFAIWDDGVNGHVRSDLVTQTISEYTDSSGTHRVVSSNEVRWEDEVNSSGVVTATKHHGWVLDLLDSSAATLANGGERTVNNSILRDGRIIFSTLIPSSDACASGGTGWVLFVDAVDGGAPESAAYDANNDGELDNDDMIDTDGDGIGDTYGSGTALDGGIPTMPAFIDNTANDTTIGYSTDSEGNIDTTLSPLDALVNKRLYWRELR
jgi:type IV pilus assembly protein PilY1